MASSVLGSSEAKTNRFKLMRLIVDGGTNALKNIFLNKHPGNLHIVLSTHHATLKDLYKKKGIITKPQWDKLYPHPPKIPNIQEFDITLLVILLRNICGLTPPSTGWNDMPNDNDNSCEANIVRIRIIRNCHFAHIHETDVSASDFETVWEEVSSPLVSLGISQAEIDRLKEEECGEEEVNRVRRKWRENEGEVKSNLDDIKKYLKEIVHPSSDDILRKCLYECDFKNERQCLEEAYTKDTREWVFQQVEKWLNSLSDNRAFIISAQAGMGKSTIAAIVCKRFPEQFAACHFCQFNDNRYNKPSFLLQSLAFHLCNVFPKYKEKLSEKLFGKKDVLEDMNIAALFSMLFKEPLTDIPDPGKIFLIVIDALDESRQKERYELVDLIANHFHKLPKYVRFLITTRPENDIARKFQKLNPMVLKRCDEPNLRDLRLFFDDKLKTVSMDDISRKELVENLVKNSEGLILYASFVCKISEDDSIKSNLKSLPKGIDQIYESYFNRLEKELAILNVDEEKFLRFLSVIAVAERPLPKALIETLFRNSEGDSLREERMVQETISCISSLLVINDQCVSFFHKSVKDWLLTSGHRFSIIEKCGHKILAEICENQMESLKINKVRPTSNLATKYALQFGIPHILQADLKEELFLTKLVDYVTDLEILHASVCIDVYTTLTNLTSLEKHIRENSLGTEEMHETINMLIFFVRKFSYILKDFPQSFLQHVINESNDKRFSTNASVLLETRYKELAYFETKESRDDHAENGIINCLFRDEIVCYFDVSPREDFLICVYEIDSTSVDIELFSLPNFQAIWKKRIDYICHKSTSSRFVRPRNIVFHPSKEIIFPGKLDKVLTTTDGTSVPGPFTSERTSAAFAICCFSNDDGKMATNHYANLIVWNLLDDNREKVIARLSCEFELTSILFSANDRFLATTNKHELFIYDTENSYDIVSRFSQQVALISTFDSDSWIVKNLVGNLDSFSVVKNGQKNEPVQCKPSDLFPLNMRAAKVYQAAVKGKRSGLLERFDHYGGFFMLSNESALAFHFFKRYIHLIRSTELFIVDPIASECALQIDSCTVSVDGKYIYSRSKDNSLQISMCSNTQSGISTELVQVKKNSPRIVPAANGTFAWTINGVCELWSFDMTQLLFSFPEFAGTVKCLSVADNLVACVMESQVCFLNVSKREIVACVPLPKTVSDEFSYTRKIHTGKWVIACSSLYHVLVGPFLFQDEKNRIDLRGHIKSGIPNLQSLSASALTACFSPNGSLLAFSGRYNKKLFVFDIHPFKICCELQRWLASDMNVGDPQLEFVDEKHLLYAERSPSLLRLVNVKTCDTLTCIDLDQNAFSGFNQISFCVCRKTGTIVCYFPGTSKQIKTIKLWLPHQRDICK